MHTGSKGSARIDMNDHFALIFRFHLLPGRNDENIIHIELMKILFPVVDPVLIFCFGSRDRALTDIHKVSEIIQLCLYPLKKFRLIRILFHIEIQISDAVILGTFRQDIHKHLLLIGFSQRNLVLDLNAFHTCFCQRGDHNILHF